MTNTTEHQNPRIDVGVLCRSRDAIMKLANDEQSRLCRRPLVPDHRWRQPHVPEYNVQLLTAPP